MSVSNDPEDWATYFRLRRLALEEAAREAEEHDDLLEIIEPSRPATVADLNTSLKSLLASLAVYGFVSASQVTRVLQPGKEFKTGERAGEVRPDKEMTNVFIHAAHSDLRHLSAWYVDGKLQSAKIRAGGEQWRVVERVGDVDRFIEGGN